MFCERQGRVTAVRDRKGRKRIVSKGRLRIYPCRRGAREPVRKLATTRQRVLGRSVAELLTATLAQRAGVLEAHDLVALQVKANAFRRRLRPRGRNVVPIPRKPRRNVYSEAAAALSVVTGAGAAACGFKPEAH